MERQVSKQKRRLAEEEAEKVREDYVQKMRDNYPLIIRTLMHDLIVSIDKGGNLVFLNDAAAEFWGMSSEELVGTHFTDYLYPEDVKKTQVALQEIIKSKGQVKDLILRVKSPRGARKVAWNAVAIFDEEGNYVGTQTTGKDITDLLRTEEELEQSRSHFRRLFEVLMDPIVIVDLTGTILEVSQSAEEILGFPREKIVGKRFLETRVAKADTGAVMIKNLGRMKKGMYILPYAIEAVTKDGKKLFYEVNPARIVYKGEPAILAIFRNLTSQKTVEHKLQESEKRFNHFLENAPEAIWVQDLVGTFLDGNKVAEELTGYRKEELIGKNMLGILVPPESIPRLMEAFKPNDQGGISGPNELELIRKDGSLISVEASTIPVERDGKIEIIGIVRDITERKKQEELLRIAREKFETYFDLAKVMLIAIDAKGNVTQINKKGCEVLGYKKEQILGKNWFNTFLPKRMENETKAYFKKLLSGQIEAAEYKENPVLTKAGKERLVAWHNIRLRDEQGNIKGTLSSGRDITDRKKAEEALKESEERFRSTLDSMLEGCQIVD